jgi:hypothetical protein
MYGTCFKEMRNAFKSWVESQDLRDHVEDLGLDMTIMLKLTLEKLGVRVWTGFKCLRIGLDGRFLSL